jgi:hypothetical protein
MMRYIKQSHLIIFIGMEIKIYMRNWKKIITFFSYKIVNLLQLTHKILLIKKIITKIVNSIPFDRLINLTN